jgi:hypothetical protein
VSSAATVRRHLLASAEVKRRGAERCAEDTARAAAFVTRAFRSEGRPLLCGNGPVAPDPLVGGLTRVAQLLVGKAPAYTWAPMFITKPFVRDRWIRFALVGCGRISANHIEALDRHEDRAELVGVCDIDPKARARAQARRGSGPWMRSSRAPMPISSS